MGAAGGQTVDLRGLPGRARDRMRQAGGRIALAAVTSVAAWLLAQVILRQPTPIFAPIAAVVCLTDSPAVRGRRAVRLLAGVLTGVVVGELATSVVGGGWLQVGLGVVVGMVVVTLGSINPLTLLQSGIAALLVVGLGSAQTGWTRLSSAAIGGALALLVSQVLVTPSPVRMLASAASAALRPIADALGEVGGALRDGSPERARDAAERLRAGHDDLGDFLDSRTSADRVAVATLRGRRERGDLARLQERLEGVPYVHASAVLLARTAAEVVARGEERPEALVDGVDGLAAALRAVADDPRAEDPDARREGGPGAGRGAGGSGAGGSGGGRPGGAHEVADELAGTDPDRWSAGPAQLATQVHLLAVDVAALTSARQPAPAT